MNYINGAWLPGNTKILKTTGLRTCRLSARYHRFHAAIWAGYAEDLNIALPKQLYVHGFINVEGQKMSKSIGNVTPK